MTHAASYSPPGANTAPSNRLKDWKPLCSTPCWRTPNTTPCSTSQNAIRTAIAEQLSIDQPPGIRAHYQALLAKTGDAMAAQHEVMDCLAEMIWQSQRQQTAYDPALYFACLQKKSGQVQDAD
jgi:hypothetical protein